MHLDLRAGHPLAIVFRYRPPGAAFLERAALRVVAQHGAAGTALVRNVCPFPVWMKSELPGVGLVLQSEKCRIVRGESPLRGIDAVDKNFVQSGVGCNKEAIVGREVDGMAVHFDPRTSWRHTGAFTGMLVEGRGLSERAVLMHGNRDRAAARPVRRGRHRTRLIETEMTRHHSLGRGPVQLLQLSGLRVDREGGHVAGGGFAVAGSELVHSVEEAARGVNCKVATFHRKTECSTPRQSKIDGEYRCQNIHY